MHFHLPKPPHGWREFLTEVLVVVIGILIAIGAEQTVEAVHHRSQVREATEKLHDASLANRGSLQFDVAVLRDSMKALQRDQAALQGCSGSIDRHALAPIELPVLLYPSDTAWLAVRDTDLLPLLPPDRVDDYWKIDTIGSLITPMAEEVRRTHVTTAAAVETLREGIADNEACHAGVWHLHQALTAQQVLLSQIIFYQLSNEQVLRGEHLDVGSARTRLQESRIAAHQD